MVHLFLEQADKLGIHTPLDYQSLRANQPVIDALRQNDEHACKMPFPAEEYLPAIAMAQHYGVPTRLLDWTESPLVAAYFAAEGASRAADARPSAGIVRADGPSTRGTVGSEDRQPTPTDNVNNDPALTPDAEASKGCIAIYLLRPHGFGRDGVKDRLKLAFAPRYGNENLRAQRGLFVYLPHANETFMETGKWPSIDDVLASARSSNLLNLLTLPASEADALLRLLWRYQVTRHHLKPSLENAARAFSYARALFPDPQTQFFT